MTSFKRWFGAGAIVLVALALVACPGVLPKVVGEIPDMQFAAGAGAADAKKLQLDTYFSIDRDATYKATSSDPKVATANVPAGSSVLTVTPVGPGTTNVTVTGSKGGNDPVSQTFSVTVAAPVSDPPTITGEIGDIQFAVGATDASTVDLGDYFEGAATYEATSSMPSVAAVSVSDAVLTVTPAGPGSTNVKVTATNDDGSVSQTFSVMVAAPPDNIPPVVRTQIGNMSIQVGMERMLTLSDYYLDPDALIYPATLTYTAESSNESIATVSTPSNSVITIAAVAVGGPVLITVTASDATGIPVPQVFAVVVTPPPPNQAPSVRTIPDVTLLEGTSKTRTLSDYATDPEGDTLSYTAESGNEAVATVSDPDADSMITINAVAEGTATISVSVSDGMNAAVEREFEVTVTATDNNQPYRTAPLPDLTGLKVDVEPDPIDLSNHFADDEDDNLEYDATSDDEGVVKATVSGSMLMIEVVAPGTATINVTVEDDANNQVKGSFDVMVVNQPPMIVADEPTKFGPYLPGDTQKIMVSEYFTDAERDSLMYTADSSDDAVATTTDPDADSNITITAAGAGMATITITANDGTSTTTHELTVTVNAVPNEEPEVVGEGIPPQSLQLVVDEAAMTESATTMFDVAGHFNDPDNQPDPLSYSTDSDMATIAGSMLTITASAPGTTMITVTASDGEDEVSDTFAVMVSSPERPETSSELPDQDFDHDDMTAREFMLSNYFSRATGYELAVTGDADVVTAAVDGGMLTLTPGMAGRAVVMITPSNSGGDGSSQTITVEVEAAPPTPVPTSIKPLQAMITESDAAATTIELDDYFSGATDYMIGSNNEDALAVSLDGHTLTLTPGGTHGDATVTVTPMNDSGNGTAQTFIVTVRARPMLADDMDYMDGGEIKVVAISQSDADAVTGEANDDALVAAVIRLMLGSRIEDPDGDDAELKFSTSTKDSETVAVYAAPSDGTADANLEMEGAMTDAELDDAEDSEEANVTLRGRKAGDAEITVVATDEQGLESEWTFTVKVAAVNSGPTVVATAFPGASISETDNADYFKFVRIGDQERFKSTDTAPRRLKIKLGADSGQTNGIFNDVNVHQRASGDSWEFDVDSTDPEVVTATLEPTGVLDEYNVVITPQGSGIARVYFTVEDSFGQTAGGKDDTETVGDITAAATDGLVDNTSFLVRVNHKPMPYSGDGDDRKSLSTEMQWMSLVAAGTDAFASAQALVDDTTNTTPEGYFSDEDNQPLLCRLMETTGDSVGITIATRNAFTLTNPENDTLTGQSTFRIRCFDQVDANSDGTATDFEWAEDTLTVNVAFLQSISD